MEASRGLPVPCPCRRHNTASTGCPSLSRLTVPSEYHTVTVAPMDHKEWPHPMGSHSLNPEVLTLCRAATGTVLGVG